jgi:hypothetical protein
VLEVNEKRKERVNASEASPTGAGVGEGTPAKKKLKAKTTQSESKKVVEPIRVLDFATFLTELGDDWGAAMETADFSKESDN